MISLALLVRRRTIAANDPTDRCPGLSRVRGTRSPCRGNAKTAGVTENLPHVSCRAVERVSQIVVALPLGAATPFALEETALASGLEGMR